MNAEDRAWRTYVERFRRDGLQKIIGSGSCISLYSGDGSDFDVKQATELGAILLLDKPLILVTMRGAKLPSRLAKAADVVLEGLDLDDPRAQEELRRAVLLVSGGGP